MKLEIGQTVYWVDRYGYIPEICHAVVSEIREIIIDGRIVEKYDDANGYGIDGESVMNKQDANEALSQELQRGITVSEDMATMLREALADLKCSQENLNET